MVDFVFPSGSRGWIYGNRGTVRGLRKWSETHVSTSGGGGYVGPQGGHVASPTVHSSVTTRAEFWVRSNTGAETQCSFDVPVADGHEFSVLWGNVAGRKSGSYLYWKNYSTSRHAMLSISDRLLFDARTRATNVLMFIAFFVLAFVLTETFLFRSVLFRLVGNLNQGMWSILHFLLAALAAYLLGGWTYRQRRRARLGQLRTALEGISDRKDIALDG